MRKVFGAILFTLLLIMAVTGCSSKANDGVEADKGLEAIEADKALKGGLSKGRYVEEDMVFPEGVAPNEFVSIAALPDGEIELYACNNNSYEKYLYVDKKWRKEKVEALQKFNDSAASNFILRKVFYGEDRKQYLFGDTPSEYRNVLYRLSDTGEFEKVEIKRFEDTYEELENVPVPYLPKVIKVLKNGMIAAVYPWGVIEVYSPDGQSVVGEYHCGVSCILTAEGNTLYYADQNDKEILSVNMETKIEGTPRTIDIDIYDTGIFELENGTAYVCNTRGLHLNMEGASLWETLIEGSQSSLSMPSGRLKDFKIGKENEYYIVLSNMYNSGFSIKHIYYDEDISSVSPVALSIFSIEDSPSIRQAIALFQESHPDISINFRVANTDNNVKYTYGIKNPKQTITLKDQINALNTELLAGKGPDIFVLDGMPIQSYIDKGVLEDMGSIFSSLRDTGELMPNITDSYDLDGKVYTMPIRFKLPVIYGVSDAVNAAKSITELAKYARDQKEIPLFTSSNYRALAAWLFMTYYDQIPGQDNEIDEVALREFFETIQIISEAIHASDDAKIIPVGDSDGASIWITCGYWTGSHVEVYKEECQANMVELGRVMDFAMPITVIKKRQGEYKPINHRFKAYGLVGINSAGEQKELAKEFIKLLFSNEVQGLDLRDGFPVNRAAMEEWFQNDEVNYFSIPIGEAIVTAYYPEKAAREKIYEYVCAADKPMVNDMTMMDMILDEAERYLRGDISSEQAASNAVASIHLYLSE